MRPIARMATAPLLAVAALAGTACSGTDSIGPSKSKVNGATAAAAVQVVKGPTASVSVSPANASIVPAQRQQLVATALDADGRPIPDPNVKWSSSDLSLATVSDSGLVTGVGQGTVIITAQVQGKRATAMVSVASVATPSVSVSLGASTLSPRQTTQATAVLKDAQGDVRTGRTVTWSSASPEVATVSATGVVTAAAAGTASIVATIEGQIGAAAVTVTVPAPVATVSVTVSSTSLTVGKTVQATATLRDSAGNVLTGQTVGWTSSNAAVATVSPSGLVTGVVAGSATITATSEGKSGSVVLTVNPVPVAIVSVALGAGSLAVGQTTQAVATLKDAAGNVLTGRAVTWASSAPAVASVSSAGLLTALAAGTAAVTAMSEGQVGTASVTVAATPPPSGAACRLVTDLVARAEAPLAKPGYRQSAIDPAFGTTLVRVTGDPGDAIPTVGGAWPQLAGPGYAKRQGWSADGAFLMVEEMSGALGGGVALLLDGTTYQPIRGLSTPAASRVWHPSRPDVMIGVTTGGSVITQNVRTNTTTTVVSVSGYTGGWIGKGEGNPSNDGRYVPVRAIRSADGREVVFVADATLGTKSADLDVAAQGFSDLDWVGVSQTGRYLLLFGTLEGVWGRSKVYDRATLALVSYWSDHPVGHADLGLDAAGNDVLFGGAAGGPYVKRFIARRLDNGQMTPLTGPVSYNWHASTRNTARPGWGYVVTNDASGSPLDRNVYAVALDGSGRLERLAHHRSAQTDYEAYPFAVPSPDGRRVLMRSNWGASAGRPVQGYVVDARPLCQ